MGCIDSWYYPNLNFGSCTASMRSYTDYTVSVDSTMNIPGKQPSIEIKMTWCGCDEVDQCFVLEVDCAADTQVGYINLLGENIPSQLPFCIEDTTVDGWHMFIESYGGYTPIMDPAAWEAINGLPDGMRGVHQFDILTKDGYATCGNTYIGYGLTFTDVSTDQAYINMLYTEYDIVWEKICCCHKLYYVEIDTSCNNMGCIDSWYYPDLNFGSCTAVMRSYTDDEVGVDSTMNIPGKQPSIEIKMTWCGCDEVDQCFVLILTQKNFINGIPNSRFSIYIAS
jgi:hypothetical protein